VIHRKKKEKKRENVMHTHVLESRERALQAERIGNHHVSIGIVVLK
jgi:hypothetical protein